jgi:hypothetical protein
MSYRDKMINTDIDLPEADVSPADRKLLSESVILSNFNKLCKAIGTIQVIGADCTDNTSTSTECKLILPADQIEVGDVVVVGEGGTNLRIWYIEITGNDNLAFTDADLINGADSIADYDTIKNDLMIWVIGKSKLFNFITKNQLLLNRTDKGINDNVIPSSTTFLTTTSTIKEILEYLYSICTVDNPVLTGVILRPTADGLTGWDCYPDEGENNFEDIDEEVSDGDDTYISHLADDLDFAIFVDDGGGSPFHYIKILTSTDYVILSQILTRQPSNNKPWSKAAIGAATFGVQVLISDYEDVNSCSFDTTDVSDTLGIAGVKIYAEAKRYHDEEAGHYYYRVTRLWLDVIYNSITTPVAVAQDSVIVGTQPEVNFTSSDSSVKVTITEDVENTKIDIDLTISDNVVSQNCPIYNPNGLSQALKIPLWRAPFKCYVKNVMALRVGGTGATINACINGVDAHLASDLSLTSENTKMDGGAVQNVQYDMGDILEVDVVTVTGKPTFILVQIDLVKGESPEE